MSTSARKLNRFCENTVDCLLKTGYLKQAYREWYIYAFQRWLIRTGISSLIFICGTILFGVVECIIYLLGFLTIRKRAGGYHAKTPTKCLMLSLSITLLGMWFCSYIAMKGLTALTFFINVLSLTGLYVFCNGGPNSFSDDERKTNRRLACVTGSVLVVLSILLSLFSASVRVGAFLSGGVFIASMSTLIV